MTTLGLVNIGDSISGADPGAPVDGDAVICRDGHIAWIGDSGDLAAEDVDTLLDVQGACLVPGLIDSHVHITFGDYSPRQQVVGFLDSYLHGGMTRAISASEVHVPGRPSDPMGVVALAIAAHRCFAAYRPSGVTVHAGSIVLEPGVDEGLFDLARQSGVWLAKAGFGAFPDASGYVPVVRAAQAAGITVMLHTGGGSISGTLGRIGGEDVLAIRPDIIGHVNGGPTALSRDENTMIVDELGDMRLQLVQAGNLRSAIHLAELALERDRGDRLLIASDTPTGTGVIPLALLRSMAELVSLGPLSPQRAITATTGNVAAAYGLDAGELAVGRPADLVVIDAPLGSAARTWDEALALGDLPAVAAVITEGAIRLTHSRNTPPPQRAVKTSTSV